jgi:hypothetical protein
MSANNDTIINNLSTLTHDDLIEAYDKLADKYLQQKTESDEQKQQIYNQSQQIRTLMMSQNDLQEMQNEIDIINENHRFEIEEVTRKHSLMVDAMRKTSNELENDKVHLEEKINDLEKRVEESNRVCDGLKLELQRKSKPRESFSHEYQLKIEHLQQDLNEMKFSFEESQRAIEKKDFYIQELNEEISCLKENLDSKKIEIEEKDETLDSLHEKIQELTMELSMLRSIPEDDSKLIPPLTFFLIRKTFHPCNFIYFLERKGNSLFAEVDDQRQKMKDILQAERRSYLEMRKLYNSKEIEIRKLKRENTNIRNEIEACSTLLRRGETIENEALKSQINQLTFETKKLERTLKETQQKVIDLANQQNLGWIETILTSSTNDQREAKDKLIKTMMEKSALADTLKKEQKELVKCKLDVVKLKIFLEKLVLSNNIKINELDYKDIGIDPEIIANLQLEDSSNEIIELDESCCSTIDEMISEEQARVNEVDLKVDKCHSNDDKENSHDSMNKQEHVQLSSPTKPLKSIETVENTSLRVETVADIKSKQMIDGIKVEKISTQKRTPFVVQRIVIPSRRK